MLKNRFVAVAYLSVLVITILAVGSARFGAEASDDLSFQDEAEPQEVLNPYGLAGRIPASGPDSLTISKVTPGTIRLDWGPSCAVGPYGLDTDYEVYGGTIGSLPTYDHGPVVCSTGANLFQEVVHGPYGEYYLVVPVAGTTPREGSYGESSAPAQRPQLGGACLLQRVDACALAAPATSDPASVVGQDSIDSHIQIVGDGSLPEQVRQDSRDALLTALSAGFENLETGLKVVRALADNVDVSLYALLASHLEEMREEAEASGRQDLVRAVDRALRRLE